MRGERVGRGGEEMVVLEEGSGCCDEYQMGEVWDERKWFEEDCLLS